MSSRRTRGSGVEKTLSLEEQKAKIAEVRKLLGPIADKLPALCLDASISRYLRARAWNAKKACKMVKDSLRWRLENKPENIRWEDIAQEATTGKIYRSNYFDKYGRTVLVMRPGFQNSSSLVDQIKYLVYCMENAILNLTPGQEQMVWLIDFQQWNMSSISVKATRETANVLQNHYPERLGLAILYNPPKIFESFYNIVKLFLEHKTYSKVKFVYSDDPESQQIMENLFDMDKLESSFGGRNLNGFDYSEFSERMKEDDVKMLDVIKSGRSILIETSMVSLLQQSMSLTSDASEGFNSSSEEDGFQSLKATEESSDEKTETQVVCEDGETLPIIITDDQTDKIEKSETT
ncbi:hypothetical protein GIB67_006719 [Kingdonia uniflora]|uniref:CRAL-TRIO domain-containing protein n=1 Tax=Kingdonia uniflora TaxID=39325 RepID=A0A7J7LYL7_9MAGN|nr:hypothetical protein GIB67_006719 [Kingdonia uniflora]